MSTNRRIFSVCALAGSLALCALGGQLSSCSGKQTTASQQDSVNESNHMTFNADSAYDMIKTQLDFGPRVPGSEGHARCAAWMEQRLRQYGADSVVVQRSTVRAYTGQELPMYNVIAMYNPELTKRVLFLAHWDTRPWADHDPDDSKHNQPVPGANDGASGVAVLLEMARNFQQKHPDTGVDLMMVDCEDYGRSGTFGDDDDSWCLGTQYFVNNLPYANGVRPEYAVLLDMVGGRNAVFTREYTSEALAKPVTDRVWQLAKRLGYADRFSDELGIGVVDDHTYLNKAGIPAAVIIEASHPETQAFPPQWHTVSDDIRYIDTSTLQAVGNVVLTLAYGNN